MDFEIVETNTHALASVAQLNIRGTKQKGKKGLMESRPPLAKRPYKLGTKRLLCNDTKTCIESMSYKNHNSACRNVHFITSCTCIQVL